MIFRMASIRSALTSRPAFEQLNLVDVSERPFALWSHLGSNRFPIKLAFLHYRWLGAVLALMVERLFDSGHPCRLGACAPCCRYGGEAPTDCEWRRAVWVIAKQVTMHIAGYRDDDEFARDGCRFAWDVFETLHLPMRRDH